jgi:hypothetical protein
MKGTNQMEAVISLQSGQILPDGEPLDRRRIVLVRSLYEFMMSYFHLSLEENPRRLSSEEIAEYFMISHQAYA